MTKHMFWFWMLVISSIFIGIAFHTPFTPIYVTPLLALYLSYSLKDDTAAYWAIPLVLFFLEASLIGWQVGYETYLTLGTQVILFGTFTVMILAIRLGRAYRTDSRSNCAQFLNLLILFTLVIWLYFTALVWTAFYPAEISIPLHYASGIGTVLGTVIYNMVFVMSLWLVPLPKELG